MNELLSHNSSEIIAGGFNKHKKWLEKKKLEKVSLQVFFFIIRLRAGGEKLQ